MAASALRSGFFTACLLLGQAVSFAAGYQVPALRGTVVDQAGALDPAALGRLDSKIRSIRSGGGPQFAVLIAASLEGDTIEGASIRVVDQWKLGSKERDDGVLILLVPSERKLRIEVGQGLEGELTDVFCSRLIRQVMAPEMRRGDTEAALSKALDALAAKAGGQAGVAQDGENGGSGWLVFMVLTLIGLSLLAHWIGGGPGRRRWRGGGGGGWSSGGGGWSSGGGSGWSGGGGGFSGGGSSGSW
jgi:uncharacterized protein